jgi:Protein of unknown function (DUF3489)
MWCTRLDRGRKENSKMKKIPNTKAKTTKAPKATTAAEPTIGTLPTDQELANHAELGRQEQMATDLTKLKAGDKKRKASVKAAKAPKATPAKAAKVVKPAKAKPAKAPKQAKVAKEPKAAGTSKKDQVLALISRKNGATLDEIMTATDWQKHTVRGFIAILGKKGTKIESFKSESGARTYKAA